MEALARLLTRERVLVDLLVFKLVELRLMLLAGETRFLGWASEEVDRATNAVRDAELERAVLVTELGANRGLDAPTLTELLHDAPEPWQGLLQTEHEALRRSAGEVRELLTVTKRLADAGARSMAESLGTAGTSGTAGGSTYGPGGPVTTTAPRVQRVL